MFQVIDKKAKSVATLFDSPAEVRRVVDAHQWAIEENGSRAKEYASRDQSGRDGESWWGAPSAGQLFDRIEKGWPEGAQRLSDLSMPDIEAKSVRRRRERGDQGDSIDMQAVYRGDLSRAWTRTRRRESSAPRSITISMVLGASVGTTASQLAWRGVSALALTSRLIEAGYSVALYAHVTSQNILASENGTSAVFVEVKAEDQPLDLDGLAALSIMPGFFRTSIFAEICRHADLLQKNAAGGLGQVKDELVAAAIKSLPMPQTAIVQPKKVLDKDSAQAWVDAAIAQIEAVA